jgi:PAS domain S-box-containing protein
MMNKPLKILIVEDHDDARQNLCDILALDRHEVHATVTAAAALEHAHCGTAEVIILDRQLPDGLADELLPRFKTAAPQADMIVVTGYADLEGTIRALREGASDYILKPISPDALRASLRRIAQRRHIEDQLLDERRFAEKILDTAEAVILVLDRKGRIKRFNPYFTQLSGYALDEVRGKVWCDVFVPERDRTRVRQIFRRTLQQVETRGIVNPIVTKSGRECAIRWSNTTLKDERGQPTEVLSVGLDVTDLFHAQEQLLQAERLAAIGQTMAGLAHESRNALQRIQAALELLELQFEDDPEVLRDLATIDRASRDLRNLLEEVRAYAAPIHLETAPTLLGSLWRRAWNSLRDRRGQRAASLHEDVSDPSLRCCVDARRLEQVFRNLFENSLDACSDPVQIKVRCRATRGGCQVLIRDNGPGMPSSCHDHVFDAFFTTKPTGTGLGLAIVKRIVEAHGGQVQLTTSGPTGTEFTIFLPYE